MSEICRVCSAALGTPVFDASPPSITSTGVVVEAGLKVFVCRNCSHTQSSELQDLEKYYDTDYQISLSSDDHDQLYEIVDGREIFRTDKQCELVCRYSGLSAGMKLLDYGAAKATTLRKICETQPGLHPHVFDVSDAYSNYWCRWLRPEETATYELPSSWAHSFDLVTLHFVLEHAAEPMQMLNRLRNTLKPGGRLFLSVPNVCANIGDFLVADHINHFTQHSLRRALETSGFSIETMDDTSFRGAFVVVARADQNAPDLSPAQETEIQSLIGIADFWREAVERIEAAAQRYITERVAIYGAGFYGSLIASRLANRMDLACFIDRNPHVASSEHFGRPVVAPAELPLDVTAVFAGLNPAQAQSILPNVEEWQNRDLRFVYLQDAD